MIRPRITTLKLSESVSLLICDPMILISCEDRLRIGTGMMAHDLGTSLFFLFFLLFLRRNKLNVSDYSTT